jgi:tetratricopeptide (TPR) repeat protein
LRGARALTILPWVVVASTAWAQPRGPAAPPIVPAEIRAEAPRSDEDPAGGLFAVVLRAYQAALTARRLGHQDDLRREDVASRVAESEQLSSAGRLDEVIARLTDLVERPQFALFGELEEGRAAVFRLGDALATAGIALPARAYLRQVIQTRHAWDAGGTWARLAVRRLVDIALADERYGAVAKDLEGIASTGPEDVRGEIAYMNGRAKEAAGDPEAAMASYALVTQRCRFWAQATYLSGLIQVERGRHKDAEDLLCRVADPRRSEATTPVFADEKFFAVRDLARLGLGRIAHEDGRNDDARYYYYLVPRDSDRLAEALYEAATTRYEKKDYKGARELLDELAGLRLHHRYEDEAWVLDAWVDLARCRFPDADKKLVEFLARFEPVRDGARRIANDAAATRRLLDAVHGGIDASTTATGGVVITGTTPEVVRTIATLLRVDPAYERILHRRGVLEREASGLVYALATIDDMQRALATNGGVRPATELAPEVESEAQELRLAVEGVERQIADLAAAHAAPASLAGLHAELGELTSRFAPFTRPVEEEPPTALASGRLGEDLSDLFRADALAGQALNSRVASERKKLGDAEATLAADALRRLDLRLSRLLRRARLGRIESVLGRKRALEVEVQAIRLGYLPQDAVDSLEAGRYLEDSEEYWPFEGDDWPDEYVGRETK